MARELPEERMEALLESDEIELEQVRDARQCYRDEVRELARQLRDFRATCAQEGLAHLKSRLADGLGEEAAPAPDPARVSDAEAQVRAQLVDVDKKLQEIERRKDFCDAVEEEMTQREAANATRLASLETADQHLRNIERDLERRQEQIKAQTTDLFEMERQLRQLRGEMQEELREFLPEPLPAAGIGAAVEKKKKEEEEAGELSAETREELETQILSLRNLTADLQAQVAQLQREVAARDARVQEAESRLLAEILAEAQEEKEPPTMAPPARPARPPLARSKSLSSRPSLRPRPPPPLQRRTSERAPDAPHRPRASSARPSTAPTPPRSGACAVM